VDVTAALILTGAPGVGKTSVLESLCMLLEIEEVRFSAIESEQFSRGYPWLSFSEWIPQLAAVVSLQRKAGRSRFLVAATAETSDELSAVSAAVHADRQLVVCLKASPDAVAERIAAREPDAWPGKAQLVNHARVLALEIPRLTDIDLVIPTENRAAPDIAIGIRDALRRRHML
jgi:hypothetical protein